MKHNDRRAVQLTFYKVNSLNTIHYWYLIHLVDIWNVIEAFRENGLNTLEPQSEVSVARLETLVSSLYHNLNKRLPTRDQVPVDSKAGLLLNWLISAYSNDNSGKIRVFSIKVALAIMCSGKLVDKLRYIFSQISDGAGQLVQWKLCEFLREILALPAAVYESPTFHYKDGLESEMFSLDSRVTVNDFISVLVSVTVVHVAIRTNYVKSVSGTGRVSLSHQNDHEVKEYTSYKSPTKQIGHSLRKSFRCVPEKSNHVLPRFPEQPEKTLNLSHIVPPSPLPSHNGFESGLLAPFDRSSTLDSRATGRSLDSAGASLNRASTSNDEEHRLIARYAARLAQESRTPASSSENASLAPDNSQAQRQLIAQLESKNKEIMREIARLRRQQEAEQLNQESPALMNELRALRQRKGELEGHLGALQDSRRQLMVQLEGLMRMLKSQQTSSPRSTPNSSPRSGKSPPMPQGPQQQQQVRNQMPPHSGQISQGPSNHSDQTSGGFAPQNGSVRGRGDLHFAADSVTSAMSTLVRELNSGESDEETSNNVRKQIDFEESKGLQQDWNDMGNANTQWQEQFAQWNINNQN
ncbi:hypothetical protein HA402_005710 [Bradysia odoriphaga]|nr:hypothetical protein HA402_005710 [Bradysia odoriphaga]